MMTFLIRLSTVFAAAWILLFASLSAHAELRSVEDEAFACKIDCIYFDDFRKKSKSFRNGLDAAIKKSGVKVDKRVYAVVTPMIPVVISGRPALIGSTCEKHNCPHQLHAAYYRNPVRIVALYFDAKERKHPIGQPSPVEMEALSKVGDWTVGEAFGP